MILAAAIVGCGDGEGAEPQGESCLAAPNLLVTEGHDGSIVPMRPGDVLEVRLPGSRATDHPRQWAIAAAPPQLRPCEGNVAPRTPAAAGAGAVRVFRFAAVAEGEGRLVFVGGEPSRRISFQVHSYSDMIID